jgi:hypothetical protein
LIALPQSLFIALLDPVGLPINEQTSVPGLIDNEQVDHAFHAGVSAEAPHKRKLRVNLRAIAGQESL